MEAVPRLPMVSFDLKVSPDRPPTEFSKLKQYIRDFYNEDPETYSTEIRNLETLRAQAVRPIKDVNGLSVLKKYYCQLHFLISRFPMEKDGAAAVGFTWRDIYSTAVSSIADVKYEMVAILYNIGALHTLMGASQDRTSPEGLKMACTHFQCAAWAFQHIKDSYPQPAGMDLSPDVMNFMYHLCLAQAQECILEKSMTDNRKATINAKVATQIVDYYNLAYAALTQQPDDPSTAIKETVGLMLMRYWKRYVKFKCTYYASIALLYQGMQSEEQQKMGERVAYYQAAMDKLTEAIKLSKSIDQSELRFEGVEECMSFTRDVVEGKRKAAKSENEFIYHEEVPDIDTLTPVKGATLVKGIPFSVTDPDISGPDIFAKLIPLKAHQASSMYSEEKAKLLRKVNADIDAHDEEVVSFMSCLQLEHIKAHQTASSLPQEVVDRCAALSVNQDAIPNLIGAMDKLNDAYHDVDAMLQEIMALIKAEELSESSYQDVMGKRPPSIVATDLSREANKYMEAHKKAADSNETLNRAMSQHIENLRVLQQPLAALQQKLPSLDSLSLGDDESLKEVSMLVGKVDEMRRQRAVLASQLRESITSDDITVLLVTSSEDNLQETFTQELHKHDKYVNLIQMNLSAQEKILTALTDAYAKYAPTRKATAEIMKQREMMLSALVSSYDAYEDLLAKSAKGLEFYRKLETNLTKLLQRVKGTCRVQQEERDAILARNNVKLPDETTPQPAAPSATPKLKDYLAKRKEAANSGYSAGYDSAWGVRPAPVGSEVNAPLVPKMDGSLYNYNVNSLQYPSIGSDASIEATAPADRPDSILEQPYRTPVVPGASYSGPYGTNTVTSPQAGYLTSQVYNGSMASVSTERAFHPPAAPSTPTTPHSESPTPYTPSKVNQTPTSTYTVQSTNPYSASGSPVPNNPPVNQANAYNNYYQNYYQHYHSKPANPYSGYVALPPNSHMPSGSGVAAQNMQLPAQQGLDQSVQPAAQSYIPQTSQSPASQTAQPQVPQNVHTQPQVPVHNPAVPQGPQPYTNQQSQSFQPQAATYPGNYVNPAAVNPSTAQLTISTSLANHQSHSPSAFPHQSPISSAPSSYNQSSNYIASPVPTSNSAVSPQNPATAYAPSTVNYATNQAVPSPYNSQALSSASHPTSNVQVPASYPLNNTVSSAYGTPAVNSTLGATTPALSTFTNTSQAVLNNYAAVNQSAPANYVASQATPLNYIKNALSQGNYSNVSQPASYTSAGQSPANFNTMQSTPLPPQSNQTANSATGYANTANNLNYAATYQANQAHYAASQSTPLNYSKTNVGSYGGVTPNNYSAPSNYQVNMPASSYPASYGQNAAGYVPQNPQTAAYKPQNSSAAAYNSQNPSAAAYSTQNTAAAYNSTNPPGASYGTQNVQPSNYSPQSNAGYTHSVPPLSNDSQTPQAGSQNNQAYAYAATYYQGYPPYSTGQYSGYYNYQQTQLPGHNSVAPVNTNPAPPAPAASSSSNVDLLAGLDFTVNETPLKPDPSDSFSSLSISNDKSPQPPSPSSTNVQSKTESRKEETDSEAKILDPVKREPTPEMSAPSPQPPKDPLSDPETLNQFVQEVDKFEKFVEGLCEKTLSGPTPLDMKWNELQDLQEKGPHKQTISVARCYPMKNRFPDFLPYDNSRVALPSTKDDYINASFLKSSDAGVPDMILTQSPLPNTYADFWTMIMEQHVELIVCLLADSQMDGGVYWPTSKSEEVILGGGTIKVSLESCNVRSHWIERLMSLTVQDTTRVIVHLQFTAWPNRWAESDGCGPWLALLAETVNVWRAAKVRTPVTVHCDGGVGRSGLFAVSAFLVASAPPRLPDITVTTLAVAAARKNPLRDRDHLKLAYQILLYHCQDLLMKRGILSSKGSNFDEKRPSKSKSHTRHPSQDFLLNSSSTPERRLSSQSDAGSTSSSKGANAEMDPLSQLDPLWSLKK